MKFAFDDFETQVTVDELEMAQLSEEDLELIHALDTERWMDKMDEFYEKNRTVVDDWFNDMHEEML